MPEAVALETDLMVAVSQILDGEAVCEYCDRDAKVTLSQGPDHDNSPMCWEHAKEFIGVVTTLGQRWWV